MLTYAAEDSVGFVAVRRHEDSLGFVALASASIDLTKTSIDYMLSALPKIEMHMCFVKHCLRGNEYVWIGEICIGRKGGGKKIDLYRRRGIS